MKPLAFAACLAAALTASAAASDRKEHPAPADLRINQIQVVGTHNSYSLGTDAKVRALLDERVGPLLKLMREKASPEAQAAAAEYHPNDVTFMDSLSYSFTTLTDQLDAGVRGLELDLNHDPLGGHYGYPAAYKVLEAAGVAAESLLPLDRTDMDKPGFKVFHMVDVDVRSSCNLFTVCLSELRDWSDAHPGHAPIFVMLEAKAQAIPIFPDATIPVPFDGPAYDAMDTEILSALGRERVITPDDVRGGFPTLESAVRAGNWPRLSEARGKFVFLLITALDKGPLAAYLEGRPNLEGRVAFLRSEPGEDHAAFLLLDNATWRPGEVERRVREGYLVRSRADIDTWEAKVNDLSRAEATFASGAQIVSTDYYRPGNAFGTDYVVRLPGGGSWRCNAVNARC
ncbi:MAG: Ca2+-dependent phosphoinositide-specific phospholipase C [Roseovarius sp.]|nr:Ca2+-dependent phosphoinositide-specific phospholipase C [Roseovarius sp.]